VCRYPGGKWFDPFGFSRGNEAKLAEYKVKEVKNGRLAILVSPRPCRPIPPHLPDRHSNAAFYPVHLREVVRCTETTLLGDTSKRGGGQ